MFKRNAGWGFAVAMLLVGGGFWVAVKFSTDKVLAQTTLGGPLAGLTAAQTLLFNGGQTLFNKTWAPAQGLGPVFTATGCNVCHFSPTNGGLGSLNHVATFFGKLNSDGSFNSLSNEGGPKLHPLTIKNFAVAGSCPVNGEIVPADATIVTNHIPPALYGDGLLDNIPDSAILANAAVSQGDGIQGIANLQPDLTGALRPGRFGRKSQTPTLIQFVADAFGESDLGITNPAFPNEHLPQGNPIPTICLKAAEPNDKGAETISVFDFDAFLAPVTPLPFSASATAGQQTFISIGCAKCHVESYTTNANVQLPTNFTGGLSAVVTALSVQTISPYSDFLVHDMGTKMADGIVMGSASGSQYRTTPLWGLSQRTLYLHDGRTTNLTTAITDHGGEAATVISNFSALSANDQSNVLAFLNSL